MKLSFKLMSILAVVTSIIAQEIPMTCGSEPSPEAVRQKEADFDANKVVSSGADYLIPINVHFHIIYDNTTINGGYVPNNQIVDQINVLNFDFAKAGIKWNLASVTRTQNSHWFNTAGPGSASQTAMKQTLRRGGAGDLNIYTVSFRRVSPVGLLGYATFPSDYSRNPQDDGVVALFSALPGGTVAQYDLGRTMTHEAGHWVGLYHTFQGGCSPEGDLVFDTPAEANPTFGCPTNYPDTCPRDQGVDSIHNFMAYTNDYCKFEFTSGQVARLRAQIAHYRHLV